MVGLNQLSRDSKGSQVIAQVGLRQIRVSFQNFSVSKLPMMDCEEEEELGGGQWTGQGWGLVARMA